MIWSLAVAVNLISVTSVFGAGRSVSDYDVIWDSPSEDSSGSMPIGNGDIGLNIWVNSVGELEFYISKTDLWSENARLLKLGRVKVKLSPALWGKGMYFRQRLNLVYGDIEIKAGPTNLVPGPAISELGALGIQISIDEGKISIKFPKIIVKKGGEISEGVASLLQKLNIYPLSLCI